MQGIIERTPCFPDNAADTNIFSREGYEGKIRFIYDATLKYQLPTDVKPFWEWMQDLNASIKEGSRIYYCDAMPFNSEHSWHKRFFKMSYQKDSYNLPKSPHSGIYQVYFEKLTKEQKKWSSTPDEVLYIKYNPKDTRYSWSDWGERKNNLSLLFEPSDHCIIHWDALDRYQLPKLEFYLHTRIGRSQYLRYMKILYEIMLEKRKEIAVEDDFIRLCLRMANMDEEIMFKAGVKAMEWWKLKNKWKRALSKDDAKALRMIVSKLEAMKKDAVKVMKAFEKLDM